MKLGIDAKWYFSGPPSGQVVVKNLIDEIIEINDSSVELYFFVYSKDFNNAKRIFGLKHHIIKVPNLPNFIANMLYIPAYANRELIDVVLFQNFGSLLNYRFKALVYIHDVLFLDFPQFFSKKELLYFRLMPLLARKANRIITISQSEKNRLLNHIPFSPSKINVVYHGVNSNFKPLDRIDSKEILRIDRLYKLPPRYILYVGRINIRKNLTNLIQAFSQLSDLDICLVIVGKIDSKSLPINSLIRTLDLQNRVIVTGQVPEDDLFKLYARATIFCFPSFAEGFGLPPLEAMQCGVPVAVSNRTCLPEVCGDAALYFDPENVDDIANKITMLLSDQNLYNGFVAKGIKHSSKFSWRLAASEILRLSKL